MNRSIPRTGLLIPPRVSCTRPATGVCSVVVRALEPAVTIVALRSVPDPAVPRVEERPFRADLRQVVEVIGRRRGRGRPLEGVRLPRVVARDLAAPERGEDVPDEWQHRNA